jgi:acetolactate synthase-1/3 small subunit
MSEVKRFTLAVLVDNEAGVLSQVSRLFSRKGFNIESLTVGPTNDRTVSRMTIEVLTPQELVELLCNQLRKMIPVHSVSLLSAEAMRRELLMIKVDASGGARRSEIMQIANIFRASIIDVSHGSLTLAIIGDDNKTDALENLLKEFGILELVRTGIVALERGTTTINDKTKEKGEFDYGKNVL